MRGCDIYGIVRFSSKHRRSGGQIFGPNNLVFAVLPLAGDGKMFDLLAGSIHSVAADDAHGIHRSQSLSYLPPVQRPAFWRANSKI